MTILLRAIVVLLIPLLSGCGCVRNALTRDAGTARLHSYRQSAASVEGVEVIAEVWNDSSRQREIPVRIYAPLSTATPLPIVIFSHGLGNDREGYEYLGRYLATHGYFVIHPQHHGSDSELGWYALYKAGQKRENWINRPQDIGFVLDRLTELNKQSGSRYFGRLDPETVAVAGHSMGAFTALVKSGLRLSQGDDVAPPGADARVDAVIALSMPRLFGDDGAEEYAGVRLPALHMTGTRDQSRLWKTTVAHRRISFDRSSGNDRYLVTLRDGTHSTFSDDERCPGLMHADHIDTIQQTSLAFLDAYLRNDAGAKQWLRSGLDQFLEGTAVIERR